MRDGGEIFLRSRDKGGRFEVSMASDNEAARVLDAAPDGASPTSADSAAAPKYWAFISYSHRDEQWATWLHRALERYKIPRALVGTSTPAGPVPKRLFPVFRDAEELPAATSLPKSIEHALGLSRNLIVICSPHAAASIWVEREISAFKALGRETRIFALIVDGEPGASDNPSSGQPEAFPPGLRVRAGAHADLTLPSSEPLAADIRQKASRRIALLKLVAGLLGVDFDALVRRDARARRWRRVQAAAAAALVLAIGTGVWYQQYRQVVTQTSVSSVRQIVQVAQTLIGPGATDIHAGVLLAIEAMHRAVELGESPEAALRVVRDGLSLLPERVTRTLEAAPPELSSAELSPDGRWVCVLDGRTVRVWDSQSGRRIPDMMLAEEGLALAFPAPDQIAVLTARDVQTWSVSPARLLSARPYSGAGENATISRDGRWLVVPGDALSLTVLDLSTGTAGAELTSETPVHLSGVSADGTRLITAGAQQSRAGAMDASIQIWDRENGKRVAQVPHQTYIESLALSGGTPLVASVAGATIRVIDGESGRLVQTIQSAATSNTEQSGTVAISPDGRWVAAGDGSQVRVWDVVSGAVVARLPGRAAVSGFSSDGRLLLTRDGHLWRMNSAAQIDGQISSIDAVQGPAIGGSPAVLAHGSRTSGVSIWNLEHGGLMRHIDEEVWSRVVAMDSAARRIVVMTGTSIGSQFDARVWDVSSGRMLAELSPGGPIYDVAFNPDGRSVWLLAESKRIVGFDTERFAELRTIDVTNEGTSMSFDENGRRLTVRGDGTDMLIDIPEGSGRSAGAAGAGPSPNQEWAVKVSGDSPSQSVALERANTAEKWGLLADGVDAYAISPDGERLVTVREDGRVQVQWISPARVIAEACRRVGRELTPDERQRYFQRSTGPDVCRPLTLDSR